MPNIRWHFTLIAPRTRTNLPPNSSFNSPLTRSTKPESQFPGGLTSNTDRPTGRLAPQGARCGLTRTPIDQPCLSLDLSTARERLAVRLCLADACDPRRA